MGSIARLAIWPHQTADAPEKFLLKPGAAVDLNPDAGADFSGMTVATSREKLAEANRRIKDFRRSLAEFLDTGEKETVARLNIQLFDMQSKETSEGDSL